MRFPLWDSRRLAQSGSGRAIELDVDAASKDEAEARARQMCDKLLANPVTEDYLLDVEDD